jgi:hypothetical protein
MTRLASRARRVHVLSLAAVILITAGCGRQVGTSPAPTPADFPGIAGFMSRHGIAIERIASGDAGCDDAELARTAIRFAASGLDQPTPVLLRIYIFRDRAAYDRRRLSVDTCARSWISDPNQLISLDAAPFVLIGQGPVGGSFATALRTSLRESAGPP